MYSWELPVGIGVFLLILGALALVAPIAATVSIAWLLGIIFIASGIAQLAHSSRFESKTEKVIHLLLAVLSILAGAFIMKFPVAGAIGVTLAMAFYFILSGVLRITQVVEARQSKGKGLLIFSALLSFGLGIYLLAAFPVASLFIPGLFLGVDLIFYGSAMIALAFGLRKAEHDFESLDHHRAA